MAACQLCGAKHPGTVEDCPERRTGQTILDKFAVGALLGVGGMAAVYAATHRVLARDVALTILRARFASDAELGARFVREARATALVDHPAFVRVHDAGTTEDGCAYIEMDRLEGIDLHSLRTAEGRVEPMRVARIAIAILSALEALHASGVIHRDLKSSNVFLVADDTIKLIDLGFAKVADEYKLTAPEQLLGTPVYISPEQYGDPTTVDARADLFSLGVVMFELLTAGWPYTFRTKHELLAKVMSGNLERHPARRVPEVPAWLDQIVARTLAHDRDLRFASAAELRAALENGLGTKPGFFRRLLKRTQNP